MNTYKFVILLLITWCKSAVFSQNVGYEDKIFVDKQIHELEKYASVPKNLELTANENAGVFNDLESVDSEFANGNVFDFLSDTTSSKCDRDFKYLSDNLKSSIWAMKMLDAYGKPESGFFRGNLKWLGDYDECLKVYAPPDTKTEAGDFHGKYCSLHVSVNIQNQSLPLSIGMCLPDSCNSSISILDELNNFNFMIPFYIFGDQLKSALNNSKVTCQQAPEKLSTSGIFVIFLIIIFALLAVIGSSITGYEYFMEINVEEKSTFEQNASERSHPSRDIENITAEKLNIQENYNKQNTLPEWLKKCKPFFNCFCLFTNGEKILNTSSEGHLLCLHGIRFLSMCWVILCHGYATVFQSIKQLADVGKFIDHWIFQIILNGFFSVDSFYLLSGFLVAFIFFKQAAKTDGKIPWVYFYVHRFIRLTPVYMMILAVYSTLHSYFGSGPLWPDAGADPNCSPDWWWNLLYINNFLTSKCMAWTWYLATDMQMYIISPLFLITLWRWPKIGYSVMGIFFCITFATNFILTYVYNLITGFVNITTFSSFNDFIPLWRDYFDIIYIKPYTRLGPYLLGIALAYYLHKRKENNSDKLNMVKLFVGWLVSSGITLVCIFGLYHQEVSVGGAAFYNSLSRTGFACGLAWVMFVCIIEQGGIVNDILSWKFWVPMSRLTFCAYLIHPIIQITYFSSVRSLIDLSHTTMIMYYLAFLITSYTAAFLTSLLFESPIIRVEKFIRNKFAS